MEVRPDIPNGTDLVEMGSRLHWLAGSIDAVAGGAMNRFTACLAALEGLVKDLGSPVAIVGGLAGIHHRARLTTLDVDIAVGKDQVEPFVLKAPRHGFRLQTRSAAGWHRFIFQHPEGDIEVHVIPEGGRSPRDPPHAPANPSPEALEVTSGLGYAAFAPWAVMKLVAGRGKDRYHLVEALQHATAADVDSVVERLRPLDPAYLKELERLLREADEARGQADW